MKNKNILLLCRIKAAVVLCMMLIPFNMSAQYQYFDFTYKNGKSKCYYKITDKTNLSVEVCAKNKEYGSYKGNVIIPDTVRFRGKTYTVCGIGDSAFFGCDKIDTVQLSESITYIGKNAFSLVNAKAIVFNNTLQEIKDGAFVNSNALSSFTVTKSMRKIGDYAFENSNLNALTINSPNLEGMYSFNNIATLNTVTIGENVQTLPDGVFMGCNNINSVYFFAEKFSGFSPFENCEALTDVHIGDKVAYLPENFVRNCPNVHEIILPQGLYSIGAHAFAQSGLENIVLYGNIAQMGTGIFLDCKQLVSAELPSALTVIVDNMFEGCENLSEIVIPENLTEIDTAAFMNCKSLPAFIFPATLDFIGKNAFEGCVSLEKYISLGENPPQLDGELFLPENAFVEIDCKAILNYTNAPFWDNLVYPCDMNGVTVQSTSQRDVFDGKRNQVFTERILNTDGLSYIITDDRHKTLAVTASATNYRDDIMRNIEIPSQITDGDNIYTVTAIESLGPCSSVFIPQTVVTIDTMALSGMDLGEITVDERNQRYCSIDGVLYSKDKKVLIAYPPAKDINVAQTDVISLPQSVEEIRYGAFAKKEKSVLSIGSNVKLIGASQEVNRFEISADNPYLTVINGLVMTKDSSRIMSATFATTHYTSALTIDSKVKYIDDNVFRDWMGDTLIVKSVTPPEIFQKTFNLNKNTVCIVPKGSLNAYKQNAFFKQMNLQEENASKTAQKKKGNSSKR